MGFIDEIKAKAKADKKTIILPESMDTRTWEAAEKILKEGLANLIILGSPEEVEKYGKGYDVTGATIIDPATYEKTEEYLDLFVELRKKKGLTKEEARKQALSDYAYYGCDFLIGDQAKKEPVSDGDCLIIPGGTLCGVETATGTVYTEIIIKKETNMNSIVKSGEVMKLKDLISYEEGSIANLDVVSNSTMKFVLMAFDEGTGLTPHRAPGNAIIFALEGKATIGYEGKDYTLSAGENFRFDKNGLHSVTAQGKFKMALLLVLE